MFIVLQSLDDKVSHCVAARIFENTKYLNVIIHTQTQTRQKTGRTMPVLRYEIAMCIVSRMRRYE